MTHIYNNATHNSFIKRNEQVLCRGFVNIFFRTIIANVCGDIAENNRSAITFECYSYGVRSQFTLLA